MTLRISAQPARAEELMNKLLDRGVSARDVLISSFDRIHTTDTVLSRTIPRAIYGLVKRLVAEGADVHVQIMQHIALFSSGYETVQDVTSLNIGSLHANLTVFTSCLISVGIRLLSWKWLSPRIALAFFSFTGLHDGLMVQDITV